MRSNPRREHGRSSPPLCPTDGNPFCVGLQVLMAASDRGGLMVGVAGGSFCATLMWRA